MISVRDLLGKPAEMRPVEVLVAEGYLVVTRQLTVLFPSEGDQLSGIIVPAPDVINQWTTQIPPFGGSRVYFAGQATVRAKFAASGIQPLPYIAIDLERIEFTNRYGSQVVYEPSRSS